MSSYTEGQIHQLADALEAAKFTPDNVTKLGQFSNLSNLRGLFNGTYELRQIKYIINCDVSPFCPDGWKIAEHCQGGALVWDISKIQFYHFKKQEDRCRYEGHKLRKRLEGEPVLNANVLEYLLENPHFIPVEWKSRHVFFWGTIYKDCDGYLVVRFLSWCGDGWDWNCRWLYDDFSNESLAVLLVS